MGHKLYVGKHSKCSELSPDLGRCHKGILWALAVFIVGVLFQFLANLVLLLLPYERLQKQFGQSSDSSRLRDIWPRNNETQECLLAVLGAGHHVSCLFLLGFLGVLGLLLVASGFFLRPSPSPPPVIAHKD